MKQAPEIRFIGMQPSGPIASAAREKAAKLERFHPAIVGCRITVELAHKHRLQSRGFAVRIGVELRGHHVTVSRVENEDAYVALREAFDDMERQLEDKAPRIREQQRSHAPPGYQAANGNGGST